MTTTSSNLGLTLYDSTTDQTVTFLNFRLGVSGDAGTSNMNIIDDWSIVVDDTLADLAANRGAIPVYGLWISANTYDAGTVASITSYYAGLLIDLTLDTTTAGTATLDISSLGAKSLMKIGSSGTPENLTGSDLKLEKHYLFIYDGTRWLWIGATSGDQMNIEGTSGNVVTVSSNNTFLGTTTPAGLVGGAVYGATQKTTLADADRVGITDSGGGNVLKYILWSDVKANLPSSNRSWFGV